MKTQLKEVAQTDLPVLVLGESGTGRRLAARTVHALSGRKDNAFVEVNCGVLHPARAKSVFLGQEGAFEQAKGGVLFLDDIDGLSSGSQVRLHHILRDLCIERSGDAQSTPVDVRVIAATGQDLSRMVKEERFHAALYYHLNLFPVKLPPLRKRKEGIPLLSEHFAYRCALLMGLKTPGLRPESLAALQTHDWPGNVWELRRILERAVVLSRGYEIGAHLLVQAVAFSIGLLVVGIAFGIWAIPVASGWQALGSMLIMFVAFPVVYYYLIRWAFIIPVVLLEGLGPREALSRSAELSAGNRGRVLGVMVVFLGISWGGCELLSIVSKVGGSVAGSVLGILYTVGITLLYFDLRVRKEGYRLAELSAELGLDGGERGEGCTT